MKKLAALSFIVAIAGFSQAHAAVTLVDKDNWKVTTNGFIETDIAYDTTRSFTETIGSGPVATASSFNGDNGRMLFSSRNSRLGFVFNAPEQNDWKTRGVLEFDFAGYVPTPSGAGSATTETSLFSNATPRFRHAFLSMEKNGWYFLVGQTWNLFGFQPDYIRTTASVAPMSGDMLSRSAQVMAMDKMTFGDNGLDLAAALARPSQRDSSTPNVDLGARFKMGGRKAGLLGSSQGALTAEGMSLAFSATMRSFEYARTSATNSSSYNNSTAWAANALIPILAGEGTDMGNTLTLMGSYVTGTGIADNISNFTGGLSAWPNSTSSNNTAKNTNLDAGFGGLDKSGNFALTNFELVSTQLQYVFAKGTGMVATLGYGYTYSSNLVTDLGGTYNRLTSIYANLFKDLTNEIRVGFEYSNDIATMSSGLTPVNERYQTAAYFRF